MDRTVKGFLASPYATSASEKQNKTKQQKFIGDKHVGKRVLGLALCHCGNSVEVFHAT